MDALIADIVKSIPALSGLIVAMLILMRQIGELRTRVLELESENKRLAQLLFAHNDPPKFPDTPIFHDELRP